MNLGCWNLSYESYTPTFVHTYHMVHAPTPVLYIPSRHSHYSGIMPAARVSLLCWHIVRRPTSISNSFSSKHKRKGSKQRTLLSIYMPQSTRVMRYCTRTVQDTNASVMSLIQYLFFVDDKLLILFIIIDLLISYFFWQELCHNAEKAEILINAYHSLYLILI